MKKKIFFLWLFLFLFSFFLKGSDWHSRNFLSLFQENNRLWLGTLRGFLVVDLEKLTPYTLKVDPLSSSQITSFAIFDNTIWISSWGEGIFKIEKGGLINYNVNNSPLLSNFVNSLERIYLAGKEYLFIATTSGLSYLDKSGKWGGYTVYDGLISNNVKGVKKYQNNLLVFGDYGLQRIDFLNKKIATLWGKDGVNDVVFWKNKFWIATSSGLVRLKKDYSFLDKLTSQNSGLKSDWIKKIFYLPQKLYFLTEKGIFSYNGAYWKDEWPQFSFLDGKDFYIKGDSIYLLSFSKGFKTKEEGSETPSKLLSSLLKYSKTRFWDRWKVVEKPFAKVFINDANFHFDSLKGNLIIFAATSGGFFVIEGNKVKVFNRKTSKLNVSNFTSLAMRDYPFTNSYLLMLGTYNQGAYSWNGEKFTHFKEGKELSSSYITGLDYLSSDKAFWIGTPAGIDVYYPEEKTWQNYYSPQFRIYQKIKQTVKLGNNYYFASSFGVVKFDRNNWVKLGGKEGLNDMEVTSLAVDYKNKFVYVGTANGGVYRWNGKNMVPVKMDLPRKGASKLLGYKKIRSLYFYKNRLYVILKEGIYRKDGRRTQDLVSKWKIPIGNYKDMFIKNNYIFIVCDKKIIYTYYNEWERL